MSGSWLEASLGGIADGLATQLTTRKGSAFRVIGESATRAYAAALLVALRTDLQTGTHEAIRDAVLTLVEELSPKGLKFSDLRLFANGLRTLVLAAFDTTSGPEASQRQIEAWFFELMTLCSVRYLAQQEANIQERAEKLEVTRLESQLGELKAAFEEKTRLLEVIRQASTPIAPVVNGILVVPLVGFFDAFRAEVLTEKLLQEVARAGTAVVILDISGVPVFDTNAAALTIRLAQALRLLGAEMILVGVSPRVARTIVELGIDFAGLRTRSTLQDGLSLALQARRLKITSI